MKVRDCLLAGVVLVAVPGCYRYVPTDAPQPGMEVRAQLAADAAVRRSQDSDEPITSYDGRIVDVTSDSLALDVLIARSSSAFRDVEIRDTVRFGASEIRSIQQRRIAPAQTALVTVAAGAAAVGIVLGIDAISGGTTDDDEEGPPPAIRIPLFGTGGLSLIPFLFGGRHHE